MIREKKILVATVVVGAVTFRPQTTSRGSGRSVVTPQSSVSFNSNNNVNNANNANNNVDLHYDAARDVSMLAPDGSRIQLMAAHGATSPTKNNMPRSPLRRPPLASPKKNRSKGTSSAR